MSNKIINIYGISNCDKVKKACKYLDNENLEYNFVDFRKNLLDIDTIANWVNKVGWENLINKRSRYYNNLDKKQKNNIDFVFIQKNPVILKRPILVLGYLLLLDFKEKEYAKIITYYR